MRKISIIFGSTTGNTERVAEMIKDQLSSDEVKLVQVSQASSADVTEADLVLYGSSTWGYGELQDDFDTYYASMDASLLKDKQVAVFGCGDSIGFGDVFCEAVNMISEKVTSCGGQLVADGLKVDGDVDANIEQINEFAKSL